MSTQNESSNQTAARPSATDLVPENSEAKARRNQNKSSNLRRRGRGFGRGGRGGFNRADRNKEVKPSKREEQASSDSSSQISPIKQPQTQTDEDDDQELCLLCCEPLMYIGLGKCNHTGLCELCSIRRRTLYKELRCPMCMTTLETIIITGDPTKRFEDYNEVVQVTSEQLGSDSNYGITLANTETTKEHFSKLQRLWNMRCPLCDTFTPQNMKQLQQHLKSQHDVKFCSVCLADRKVFLQEQKVYTEKLYRKHLQQGDGDTTIKHEFCRFCNKYFFDQDKLYEHLNQAHMTCFLCEREGVRYQYYKDYPNLEDHFRKAHFLCEDQECLEKKFIVFKTEMDLHMHDVEKHLSKKKLSKSEQRTAAQLKLEFSHRRDRESRDTDIAPIIVDAPTSVSTISLMPPTIQTATTSTSTNTTSTTTPQVSSTEEFPTLGGDTDSKIAFGSAWSAPVRAPNDRSSYPDLGIDNHLTKKQPQVKLSKQNWWLNETEQQQMSFSQVLNNLAGDNFPTLPSSSPSTATTTTTTTKSTWGKSQDIAPDNFPSLPSQPKSVKQQPTKAEVKPKPQTTISSSTTSKPKWWVDEEDAGEKKETQPKQRRPTIQDFPTLSTKKKTGASADPTPLNFLAATTKPQNKTPTDDNSKKKGKQVLFSYGAM